MGFFSFGNSKPRVSESEYNKKVKPILRSRGLSIQDLRILDMVFNAALYEKSELERGIDADEIERGVKYLRDHNSKYGVSDNHIEIAEEVFREYLKKQ